MQIIQTLVINMPAQLAPIFAVILVVTFWEISEDCTNTLQWRHSEHDSVSNHRRLDCLIIRLFNLRSKKTLKFFVTGLCGVNPRVTDGVQSQGASNAENNSIWWRHHERVLYGINGIVSLMFFLNLSPILKGIKLNLWKILVQGISFRWKAERSSLEFEVSYGNATTLHHRTRCIKSLWWNL